MSKCPFCPITIPGCGDYRDPVEDGKFIGGIGACGWCVEFAGIGDEFDTGNVQFLLQQLAKPIAHFFEGLALVAALYPEQLAVEVNHAT